MVQRPLQLQRLDIREAEIGLAMNKLLDSIGSAADKPRIKPTKPVAKAPPPAQRKKLGRPVSSVTRLGAKPARSKPPTAQDVHRAKRDTARERHKIASLKNQLRDKENRLAVTINSGGFYAGVGRPGRRTRRRATA